MNFNMIKSVTENHLFKATRKIKFPHTGIVCRKSDSYFWIKFADFGVLEILGKR